MAAYLAARSKGTTSPRWFPAKIKERSTVASSLPIHLLIHSSLRPSIRPSIHSALHLSIHPSIHPSIQLSIYPSIHSLWLYPLFRYPSVLLSIHPTIHPFPIQFVHCFFLFFPNSTSHPSNHLFHHSSTFLPSISAQCHSLPLSHPHTSTRSLAISSKFFIMTL